MLPGADEAMLILPTDGMFGMPMEERWGDDTAQVERRVVYAQEDVA